MNINKVILMGRLTADPELKTSANNVPVTRFTIAVNRNYQSKNSERKTDFIDCVAFNQRAEFLSKYFRKGSAIIAFGSLSVDSWKDKDGNNRVSTRVIVDEIQFGESKRDGASQSASAPAAAAPEAYSNAVNSDFFSDVKDMDGMDAELPF